MPFLCSVEDGLLVTLYYYGLPVKCVVFDKQFYQECKLAFSVLGTEQVYTLAKTDKQLLSHVKSRKLRYFGHVMGQPHDSIENSVMTGLVEVAWSVKNVLF